MKGKGVGHLGFCSKYFPAAQPDPGGMRTHSRTKHSISSGDITAVSSAVSARAINSVMERERERERESERETERARGEREIRLPMQKIFNSPDPHLDCTVLFVVFPHRRDYLDIQLCTNHLTALFSCACACVSTVNLETKAVFLGGIFQI